MTPVEGEKQVAVISSYRRMCKFAILMHFLALAVLYKNNTYTFSILIQLQESESLAYNLCWHRNCKRLIPGKSSQANIDFILNCILRFSFVVFATWLDILLSSSGDVHPNPGPLSTSSSSNTCSSFSSVSNNLFSSFVHYNIQSIFRN